MKKNSSRRIIIPICTVLAVLAIIAGGCALYGRALDNAREYYRSRYLEFSFEPMADYGESAERLSTPGGFYRMFGYMLADDVPEKEFGWQIGRHIKECADSPLVLVEINLARFRDRPLSDDALDMARSILDAWAEADKQIILRFLYDWDGNSASTEPDDIKTVEAHMDQLAPAVNAHAGQIYTMQGVFLGDYAEMHGGRLLNADSMRRLIRHLGEIIDPGIFLAVRTPAQRRAILSSDEPMPEGGGLAARLGLYNDGMMGSASDLGTYAEENAGAEDDAGHWQREKELSYQDAACLSVPNGGEAVIDNEYNDLENAIRDLGKMHVSYLNAGYDGAVLDKWRMSSVSTGDAWNGMDGYTYIERHLHCRYRCAGSSAPEYDCWSEDADGSAGEVEIGFTMENAGFCSSLRPLALTATVTNDGAVFSRTTIPADALSSIADGGSCDFSFPVELGKCASGSYEIYLSCADSATGETVPFADNLPAGAYGSQIAAFSVERTPAAMPSDRELLELYLAHVRSSGYSFAK